MIRVKFPCTKAQLIAATIIILNSYDEHQPIFETASPYYSTQYSLTQRAFIEAALQMPNQSQINATKNSLRKDLLKLHKQVCNYFQLLKKYIVIAFPTIKEDQWVAAGLSIYLKVSHENWPLIRELLSQMHTFTTMNLTAQQAGNNMPPIFVTNFDTLQPNFLAKLSQYMLARLTTPVATENKNITCNKIYDDTITLCQFAQLLNLPPSVADQFNFAKVLTLI